MAAISFQQNIVRVVHLEVVQGGPPEYIATQHVFTAAHVRWTPKTGFCSLGNYKRLEHLYRWICALYKTWIIIIIIIIIISCDKNLPKLCNSVPFALTLPQNTGRGRIKSNGGDATCIPDCNECDSELRCLECTNYKYWIDYNCVDNCEHLVNRRHWIYEKCYYILWPSFPYFKRVCIPQYYKTGRYCKGETDDGGTKVMRCCKIKGKIRNRFNLNFRRKSKKFQT